jgi:hypothetical protein
MEKTKDQSLVAVKDIEIVITKSDFEMGIATIVNDTVETYGLFSLRSPDGKDKFKCRFPLMIPLNMIDVSKDISNGDTILRYKKSDVIINRMSFFKGPKPANAFLNLFLTAKFNITPTELVRVFNGNIKLNGASTGVGSEVVELMVSELTRWSKDTSIPFRMKRGSVPENEFVILPIKEVARVSSVFSALSFEDVKKSVQASVLITRTGQDQTISPVEQAVF